LAKNCFSKSPAKGTGESILAHLKIGASNFSKQFSVISEEISPPIPPVKQSSCKISTFPVFVAVL